ncbi:hypothetical protein [Burkholderia cepacia]|nr:hypothetical protein [Burkholderia cepacia]
MTTSFFVYVYEALNCRPTGEYVDPGPVWLSHIIVFAWDDQTSLNT